MSCGTKNCAISPPKRTVERIRDPTPPPIVKRVVHRNQTPQPDIIERVNQIICFNLNIVCFIEYD
jgi:hypothetical protein